jgi:hypothetical protein
MPLSQDALGFGLGPLFNLSGQCGWLLYTGIDMNVFDLSPTPFGRNGLQMGFVIRRENDFIVCVNDLCHGVIPRSKTFVLLNTYCDRIGIDSQAG